MMNRQVADSMEPPPSRWHAAAVGALSVGFAFGATALLAAYADSAGWCCVHSWAMAHGTGLVVLLSFGLIGFHVVRAAGKRLGVFTPAAHLSWLSHIAYIFGTLGTFVLTEHFMWPGLIAGGAAVWLRVKGRPVQPFGLAIIGLLVSASSAAQWFYTASMF
jgi:hypothetical protein